MPDRLRILKRGDRGFHGYGPPFRDANGGEIEVYQSSASGPHVWIRIDATAWDRAEPSHVAYAHLNPSQAWALIGRLRAWIEEHGRRSPEGTDG